MSRRSDPDVRGALLVGSVPLHDAASMMTFANDGLGRHLRRIPDGETGIRLNWTRWQEDVFSRANGLAAELFDIGYLKRRTFRLRPSAGTNEIEFPPLGYAKAARESYAEFAALKERGRILDHLKFQVCSPTPLACTELYVFPGAPASPPSAKEGQASGAARTMRPA